MEIEDNFRFLCAKIIDLISKEKLETICADKTIQSDLETIVFPEFLKQQIENIKKDLREGSGIADVLFSNNFIFPFRPELIESVSKSSILADTNQKLQSTIIYYSFISWIQLFSQNKSSEFSKILLNSFLCEPLNEQFNEICCLSFYTVFLYTFSCKDLREESIDEFSEILLKLIETREITNPQIYKLITLVIRHVTESNSTNCMFIYTFISKVLDIKRKKTSFPDAIIGDIFNIMEEKIRNLDEETMHLLDIAVNEVDADSLISVVPMIMSSIITAISKSNDFLVIKAPNCELIRLPDDHKYEIIPDIVDHKTFPDDFEVQKGVVFPKIKSFKEIIPLTTTNLISPLISIGKKSEKARKIIMKETSEVFQSVNGKEHIWMQCCALLMYIYSEISEEFEMSLPVDVITNDYLFNPLITAFREDDDFAEINTMRAVAVRMIVMCGAEAIQTLLDKLMVFPHIEAETIYRISAVCDTLPMDQNSLPLLARLIICLMFYYQSYDNISDEELSFVNAARMSIFYFLSVLFQNKSYLEKFMNEPNFSEAFLILLYEVPVRSFVLQQIKKTILLENFNSMDIFINDLIARAVDIFQCLNYNGMIDVGVEFLNAINETEVPIDFYEEMCKGLLLLPKGDDSETFILESLDALILSAKTRIVTSPELAALEASILHVFGEPTQDLFIRLVQLLAGQHLQTAQPIFLVKQSKVFRLIVGVFKDSPLLSFTFKFIAELCEFSPVNCAAAATGGLSGMLIDLLGVWRADEKASLQLIASALSLLMIISTTACSVSVARSFISLLCPIEGRTLPHTQQLTLKVLNNMLVDSLKKPRDTLPLTPGGIFSTIIPLPQSFTIAFWYFSPSLDNNYCPNIADIGMLKINFKGDMLIIGHEEVRLNLIQKLWNFITITVNNENTASFAVKVNDDPEITVAASIQYKFDGRTPVSLGGANKNDVPSLIGSFGIFDNSVRSNLQSLSAESMRGSMKGSNCILYMQPYECDGFVNIRSNYQITQSKVQCSPFISFGDVLVDKCGIEMLLPLFAQWDLPMQNGSQNNTPDAIMDILSNAFKISTDAQNQFNAAGGFDILAHLLVSANSSHITYALYQKFVVIFKILVDEKARKSILSSILMNVDIWFKCNASDHLHIVTNWSRVLFKQNSSLVIKTLPFDKLLSTLVLYYWYNKSESSELIFRDRVRGEPLNVLECRKFLFEILYEMAQVSFTEEDLKLLMSTILTCEDMKQSIDFLGFLQKIIMQQSITSKCTDIGKYIALLVYLFNMKSDEVVIATLSVIVTAHRQGIMKPLSMRSQVEIIMHTIGSYFSRTALVDRILEFTDRSVPELFPLISLMTLNNGRPVVFIDKIHPNRKLASSEIWAMWPLVSAYKSEEEAKKSIINFLLKCGTNTLDSIIAIADAIGLALGENRHAMIKCILLEASKYPELQSDFILACQHFLLYQENINQVVLQDMYEKSVFFDKNSDSQTNEAAAQEKHEAPIIEEPAPKKRVTHAARHSLSVSGLYYKGNESAYTPEAAENALSILFPIQETKGKEVKSRRISMLSISGTRRKSRIVSPKKIKTVMMPAELDNRIMHVADHEFVYSFGIRFNESGEWEDEDLAKIYINKFIEKNIPVTKQAETIAGLLVRSCGFDTKGHFETSAYVKKSRAIREHQAIDNSVMQEAFNSLEDMSASYEEKRTKATMHVMKYIIKSNSNNADLSAESLALASVLASVSANCIAAFSDDISQEKSRASHLWSHLWQCMSVNHAPWSRSLPAGHLAPHYKRDMSMTGFAPLKLKKNHSFNDHLHDSLVRDTGDEGTAQKKLESYKQRLAAEYAVHAPSALLDVVEDHATTKKDIDIGTKGCIAELPCELISISRKCEGVFAILTDSIVINLQNKTKVIDLADVQDIYLRTNLHHPTAIEIFLTNGKTYLVNFPKIAALTVLKHFKKLPMPNIIHLQTTTFKPYFELLKYTEAWTFRQISNYDYLMLLNKFSGRTFNDASQYPVMPWILSDYKSSCIDLSDESVYRDLSKPIGAINQRRLNDLLEKMQSFKEIGIEPYLYSSGINSPLAVYLWLLRVEPFTTLHTEMQSGRFDHPARLFSSIPNAWNLATTTQNDFRELIPEFFSFPEFLVNANRFDLGSYDNVKVDDVVLPKWASNPYEFVYMHRKALESDYVSSHIHMWIDLIWGYKQNGKAAIDANNVYMKEMYPNIWTEENLSNPEVRAGIEAILCHVGQVPQQLFTEPHPQRYVHIQSTSCLSRPVSVDLKTAKIVASVIRETASSRYRIVTIDSTGLLSIHCFDISHINKLSRTVVMKPRSRSGSQKVISIGSSPHSKKNERRSAIDTVIIDPLEIQSATDFASSTRTIKDFCAFCMSQDQAVATFLSDDSCLVSGRLSNEMYKVTCSSASISKVIQERSRIVCASSDGSIVCVANSEAVLSFYNAKDFSSPLFIIPSFTSAVRCLAVSHTFHLAVCGTRDSTLMLCSLTNEQVTRVVELEGCRPVSCIITPSWGFICVYATKISGGSLEHMLILLSPNGDIINRREIDRGVSAWSAATTDSGFDFIVLVDEPGNFFVFEAFYLDLGRRFFATTQKVVSISIICEDNIAIAITEEGKAIFSPLQIE